MKTILVDDECWGLKRFETECANIAEIELVGQFRNATDALLYAQDNRVDLAFLDIKMPDMSGMDLASALRKLYPGVIVIFVSGYESYILEALKVRKADYFLLKPYTEDEVRDMLNLAKLLSARQQRNVEIRTFGAFDVYVDGQALALPPKAKELLAVLVDRMGCSVMAADVYKIIWGKEYQYANARSYRTAVAKLKKALRAVKIESILAYFPNAMAIRCEMVACDYFDLVNGEKHAVQSYNGNYMEEYAWGEERRIFLNSIKQKLEPKYAVALHDNPQDGS